MNDAHSIHREVCDIGRRMYERGLVAGNDGNISVRLTEEEVVCTPTGVCKGHLSPDDLCLVGMQGEQLSGQRRRTSEILLHLAILKARPDVRAVVHTHAPHATAYAITGQAVPRGATAEAEFLLGEVPIAPYETPGTEAFARTVVPFVHQSNVCLLANHGAVTFGSSLDFAYSLTEALDAYCRVLLLAQPLGPVNTLPANKMSDLHELRVQCGKIPSRTSNEQEQP